MATELMIPETINALEVFTPQGSRDILDAIKREARAVPRDISTKEGRATIAALARKIASSKVFLDDSGKKLTEDWKQRSKIVDAERKRIRDELDDLRDERRKPLTDWENKEKERVESHTNELNSIREIYQFITNQQSSESIHQCRTLIIKKISERKWEEFHEISQQVLTVGLEAIDLAYKTAKKREEEQAELERFHQEEAARLQRERDERLQAEAANRAKQEAEANAKKEQDRIQSERDEAEKRAQRSESDRFFAEENARHAARLAETKAENDRKSAAAKAKRDQDEAVRKERERIEREQKAKEAATQKREADKKHRSKIIGEIAAALVLHGINESKLAYEIGNLIADGKIPHVKIIF